jgi:hypothetical protein
MSVVVDCSIKLRKPNTPKMKDAIPSDVLQKE